MRPVLLDAEGKPLLVRNDETSEMFEIGKAGGAKPRPKPLIWFPGPIDPPDAPLEGIDKIMPTSPWGNSLGETIYEPRVAVPCVVMPLAKPTHLPIPVIVPPTPQIVPVHGLGDAEARETHEMRSRAMHRLGVDIPVDDVKRRRREEALRRLKDPPPPPPTIEEDVRYFLDGLRSRPVM